MDQVGSFCEGLTVQFIRTGWKNRACSIALFAAMEVMGLSAFTSAAFASEGNEWSFPMPGLAATPERLVVIGVKENGLFKPTEVVRPQEDGSKRPARPASFPFEANLLPLLDHRIFGVEERVQLSSSDAAGVVIRCSRGYRPAGVVFSAAGYRLPPGMRGALRVEGQSPAGFGLALAAPGEDAPDGPSGGMQVLPASIPSGAWRNTDGVRNLVVTCPQGDATATISGLHLVPDSVGDHRGTASWIWDPRPWLADPGRLVDEARRAGVDRLYLQLRIKDGQVEDADQVVRLIDRLARADIAVHAVEGDAAMATPAGRAHALDRAGILQRFKQAGPALGSFQYDIEPYLRPEYAADRAAGWREWAVTVKALSQVLGEPIEVVVPFWMLDDAAGEQALESVRGSIRAIAVMAYRTDPAIIEKIAQPWLNWRGADAIPVGIALENGTVPDEYHRTYIRASRGEVLLDRSGDSVAVRILPEQVSDSKAKPVFSLSHEVEVNSSRISFMNARQTLAEAQRRLERTLSAWPGFSGLLVHELLKPGQ